MLLNERNFLRAATLFQPKSYIYDYYMQVKLKSQDFFIITCFYILVMIKLTCYTKEYISNGMQSVILTP